MAYTNKGNIENYLLVDIGNAFDTQIDNWISAAQNYIDKYTGVVEGFEADTSAEVRYYDGNGKREIEIDEFTEISSVEILNVNSDDVGWTLDEGLEADYIEYPNNTTPKYGLRLVASSEVGAFYSGPKRIKITAKWGWATTVPKDIELAATILVSSVIEKGLKGGKISSERLGDYDVTFQALEDSAQSMGVNKILDRYKKFEL